MFQFAKVPPQQPLPTTPTRSETILNDRGLDTEKAKRRLILKYNNQSTSDDSNSSTYEHVSLCELRRIMPTFANLGVLKNWILSRPQTPEKCIIITDDEELDTALTHEDFLDGEAIIKINDISTSSATFLSGFVHDVPIDRRNFYKSVSAIVGRIKPEKKTT